MASPLPSKSYDKAESRLIASVPAIDEAGEYDLYLNRDAGLLKHRQKSQLDFAGQFGSRRLSMPDVLQALVCDHLTCEDLRNLQHCSHGALFFVQRQHRRLSRFRDPQHLGQMRAFEHLDVYQRWELKLMRFYDRPLWQRIPIGVMCVLLFPFVLLWHSPQAVHFVCQDVLKPVVTRVLKPALATAIGAARWSYERVLVPVGQWLKWLVVTTYSCALVPSVRAICLAAQSMYTHGIVPVAREAYDKLLVPAARMSYNRALVPTARFIYTHMLVPLAPCLSLLARQVSRVCQAFSTHVVESLVDWTGSVVLRSCRATAQFLPQLWHMVLCPLTTAAFRGLLLWVLQPLWRALVIVWSRALWRFCACCGHSCAT